MQKQIIKTFFLLAIFLIVPSFTNAAIIFEDNFDNSPAWQSAETLTGTSPGTVDWGSKSLSLIVPTGWSNYRSARGQLGSLGEPNFKILSTVKKGNSGQSLVATYETVNNWSGGALGKWLGDEGYDEIYIRFYEMFQPGWRYRTAQGGIIHKWFRLMSNVDDPNSVTASDPQNMYDAPYARPDWLHNCVPENSSNQCGKQAYVMLRDADISGIAGVDRIAYNPEGRAGSINDLEQVFDNSQRVWWRDYHGQIVAGNAGDFQWAYPVNSAQDWQGNGEWVQYEIHAKMNDVGLANAVIELYMNGIAVARVSDITLRTSTQTKFNYLMIPDNMFNQVYLESTVPDAPEGEQYLAIDDLVIYTPITLASPMWELSPNDGRLPLDYVINGIDDVSPSAPTGLGVI